jgi:hypothetical protein
MRETLVLSHDRNHKTRRYSLFSLGVSATGELTKIVAPGEFHHLHPMVGAMPPLRMVQSLLLSYLPMLERAIGRRKVYLMSIRRSRKAIRSRRSDATPRGRSPALFSWASSLWQCVTDTVQAIGSNRERQGTGPVP